KLELGLRQPLRFIVYVGTRLTQIVVALMIIGFLVQLCKQWSMQDDDVTEHNTGTAVFVVGGITTASAVISIVLYLFSKTRQMIEKSRTVWFTLVLNFGIFITWIIIILINAVAIVINC
ncbi:hypothetical protein H4S07_004796, partial [Coemansia furcata]